MQTNDLERGYAKIDGGAGKVVTLVTRHVSVDEGSMFRFFESQANYLHAKFVKEATMFNLNREQMMTVFRGALAKRVQFVRSRVTGVAEGPMVTLDHRNVALPRPVFEAIANLGVVESAVTNRKYIPLVDWKAFEECDSRRDPKVKAAVLAWYSFASAVRDRYVFSNGLPSQVSGGWAYVLTCRAFEDGSVKVQGPSTEADPAEATLSGMIRYGVWLKEHMFDADYGFISNPDELALAYITLSSKRERD